MTKPYVQHTGPVVYAKTLADIEKVCSHLLQHVSSPQAKKLFCGFDMEWEYMPNEKPPAVIQLCVRVGPGQPPLLLLPHSPADAPTQPASQHPGTTASPDQQNTEGSKPKKQKSHGGASLTASITSQQQPSEHPYACYILHLAMLGPDNRAPSALKQLLEHPKVVLVTVGDADERKLKDDLHIHPPNLEQVDMMHTLLEEQMGEHHESKSGSSTAGGTKKKKKRKAPDPTSTPQVTDLTPQDLPSKDRRPAGMFISMAALAGRYLEMRIDKSQQKANEAWERELTPACVAYAATDAYATLRVFEEIKKRFKALAAAS